MRDLRLLDDIPLEIRTERLLIRAPRPGDGAAINAAIVESYAELRPWMIFMQGLDEPPPLSESEAFAQSSAVDFMERKNFVLLVFGRRDGKFIGSSGLHIVDIDVPCFETGYWVRTACHGRGYSTEALRAVTEFGFEQLGAERIELRCDVNNAASNRTAVRAGYAFEGTRRRCIRFDDGLRDLNLYAMLRS
jgi:ribosomal-protein-serine acetyltransferase